MKENIIKLKSFDFALRIINLYKYLNENKKEFVLSKQLLRSGTSIGANIRESEHAESRADFIHKLSISLKEANETNYWIELLYFSKYIEEKEYQSINNDCLQIIKILVSILNSSKSKNK
jgi:four helix bundle protein